MANTCSAFELAISTWRICCLISSLATTCFRLLIFARREFNEAQVFTLLPSAVGFFPRIDVMLLLRKTVAIIPECHKRKKFRQALETWPRDAWCMLCHQVP